MSKLQFLDPLDAQHHEASEYLWCVANSNVHFAALGHEHTHFLCHYRMDFSSEMTTFLSLFLQIRIMRSPWMDPRSLGTIILLMIAAVNAGKSF